MDAIDFEYDHDNFRTLLAKGARGFELAKAKFIQNAEHWQELRGEYFSKQLSIDISANKDSVSGEVLGKKFRMHLVPLVDDEGGGAQLILTTTNWVTDADIEIDRYTMHANGNLLSSHKEVLLDWEDNYQSYRHLIAVIRRVLEITPKG
jgi:hypothetical protein